MMENMKGFEYVNITCKGCEGWLNLFFNDVIIALIRDVNLADQIREVAKEKVIISSRNN